MKRISKTRINEKGAGLVEYALLLACIAVSCIVAVGFFGSRLLAKFNEINAAV